MCGIVGIINKKSAIIEEELRLMNDAQIHRGPDGEGYYFKENIGIAHRRLSIIDVENGIQPMKSEDESVVITYNGELYNFKEIREDLVHLGHAFRTESDTEVILEAYRQWGADCLKRFRGMFAFAIVDNHKNQVFLARDHFGIKPLNYRIGKDYFAFASEIPSLLKINDSTLSGNLTALKVFLKLNYIPNPLTIYNEIFKLEPGHYLKVNFQGVIVEKKEYFDVNFSKTKQNFHSNEYVKKQIGTSVRAHLVSDVPFGSFLSGGIDSTLISSEMSKIMSEKVLAFSIGFSEEKFNELEFAKIAADAINANLESEIITDNCLHLLPNLINNHFGEPFGDSSILPTFQVSKIASKKVKMVLTGDGGDEFFAGYSRYISWVKNQPKHLLAQKIKSGKYLQSIRYLLGSIKFFFLNKFSNNSLEEWKGLVSANVQILNNLLLPSIRNLTENTNNPFFKHHRKGFKLPRLSYAQYMDIKTYLPDDILYKVDIASMANSLETRTPLIDKEIAKLAVELPNQFLCNEKIGKVILKEILEEKFPSSFIHREKQGFAIPSDTWLKTAQGKEMLGDYLFSDKSDLDSFFEMKKLKELFDKYQDGDGSFLYFQPLWNVFVFSIWRSNHKNLSFS